MTPAAQAAGEIAAVEDQMRRIPSAALRQGGEAIVEWLDELRAQLGATRKGLLATGAVPIVARERGRVELGTIAVGRRMIPVVERGRRRAA